MIENNLSAHIELECMNVFDYETEKDKLCLFSNSFSVIQIS